VSVYAAQAAAALGAIEVRAPDAFVWFGRREVAGDGEPLAGRIAGRLHDDFFGTAAPRPRPRGDDPVPAAPGDGGGDFVRALSQANGGRGAWQGGWRIGALEDEDGLRVVRADGLALIAPPEHVRCDGENRAGATAAVLLPKELRGFSPGFCIALGDSGSPSDDAARVGLYWNVAAAGAATLVARVTYALNGAGLPFSLELPAGPDRYGRGDSALLLLARDDFDAAIGLLRPLLRTLGAQLGEAAPAFALPLGRGLAVAEQPAGAIRFGEDRCRMLAEAIVAGAEDGAGDRLARVRECFAAAGVSLDAPYLQPGSDDAYAGS